MADKTSFSDLEKEYRKVLRVKIDQSDDHTDVEKQFSIVMRDFMQEVLGDRMEVLQGDVTLNFEAPSHYALAPRLGDSEALREIMGSSDLPNILGRFAESAYNKRSKTQKLDRVEEQTRNQKGGLFKKVGGRGSGGMAGA